MSIQIEPLLPDYTNPSLRAKAEQIIALSGKFENALHPIAFGRILELIIPMNIYYTNLIENVDTNPIDIHNAILSKEQLSDSSYRDRISDSEILIDLEKSLLKSIVLESEKKAYLSFDFIQKLHEQFFENVPSEKRFVLSTQDEPIKIEPGKFREMGAKVHKHVAPVPEDIPSLMLHFQNMYGTTRFHSKIERLMNIAAQHHRLLYIHPFMDGNGRTTRLQTDVALFSEGLSNGLWMPSRGFARGLETYREKLSEADLTKTNASDGKGVLSQRKLDEFCDFFFDVCIDQMEFMSDKLKVGTLQDNYENMLNYFVSKKAFPSEAILPLKHAFEFGQIKKIDFQRLYGKSDKPAKELGKKLVSLGFLRENRKDVKKPYEIGLPIHAALFLFPEMYPVQKEQEILKNIQVILEK